MVDYLIARELAGQAASLEPQTQLELIAATHQLFNQALLRGKWTRLSSWINRRSTHLLSLEQVRANKVITSRHSVGTRVVEISQIRGSSGRPNDFDIGFNPVQVHTEGRWLNIAKAYLTGVILPPVKLVQLGDTYFVQDGHHRVSVAKALGQIDIDAEVTVWDYVEPVQPCAPPCLCGSSPVLNGQLRCS
ncbi:MAG: hypothetical protein KDI62_18095 [Anaerolineae bacterium]|nr:hypothetical protein [Anaerolineae bacterium]MCB9108823.1 hypothetical protein [Anaerolineales bacterium]